MQTQPVALTEAGMALCVVCIFLAPLAAAGMAMIHAGFGRGRSAAHSMLSTMSAFAVAVLVSLMVGFSLQGYPGGPARLLACGGRSWNLLGSASPLMLSAVFGNPILSLVACLQLFSVGIAAIIPLGAGSERWPLRASCASTALLAGITFPVFAHWVWGGGWLAQLGGLASCGNGAIDAGGAAVIHAVGGLTALSITWILGPRQGKYEDMGLAIPGHNMPFVLFGCLLTLTGWVGLDSAASMLFAGAPTGSVPLIAVNNLAAASVALLAALAVTRLRYGKPDASIAANGFVIGLVAISAACCLVSPAIAAVIGLVAGLAVPFSVEWLDRLGCDDPSGSISVHAVGGLWGVLAAGLFVHSHPGQWMAQLAMIASLVGFVLPLSYGLNWLLHRFYPQRVSGNAERQGLDMSELGAGAYPELAHSTRDYLNR